MKRMKFNNILCAAGLLAVLAVGQSCAKEDEKAASILLEAPADKAIVDLADGNVRFAWSTNGLVKDGFSLVLTGDMPEQSKTYPLKATAYSRELVSTDLDILLKEWGARPNQMATLHWTVTSSADGQGSAPEERKLRVRVLPAITEKIYTSAPAANEILDLANEEPFTFSWSESRRISGYRIEFAAEADGEPVKTWNVTSGNSIDLTSSDLIPIAEALDPEKTTAVIPVFWRVVSTDEFYTGASAFTRARFMRADAPLSAVSDLKVCPGYNRVRISCAIEDPRTVKLNLKYGAAQKTFEFNKEIQSFTTELTDLPEGQLPVSVIVYDKNGNSSSEVTATTTVYGDGYKASKVARTGNLVSLKRAGAGLSVSAVSDSDLARTEVVYPTESGSQVIKLDASDVSVLVPAEDAKFGSDIEIVTSYLPVADALDTVELKSTLYVPAYEMVLRTSCKHWPEASSDNRLIAGDHGMLGGYGYEKLFDGVYNQTSDNMWHTSGSSKNASGNANSLKSSPICLTVDLGSEIYLSGLVFWGRRAGVIYDDNTFKAYGDGNTAIGSFFAYGSYNPRAFEVWVSSEEPVNISDEKVWDPADGSWRTDGKWKKIFSDCRVSRPSGNDCPTGWTDTYGEAGKPTLEDMRQAVDGFEFPVDSYETPTKGRYVRIVITENWHKDQLKRVTMDELHFYSFTPKNQ